ncbi:peptidase M23 [Sulfitobacter sp. D35]|uniref:murein hydrolase activator EnvC family protein n=1 Tax=Sulfitobacter sp. D35 TaxID=3083252 RepID=UPI00296F8074|nr:peptidase M23 [Sulfitobacter sp. D35]MDW4498285.1 peptidase M23 [Sulfitobacter sp. D35]
MMRLAALLLCLPVALAAQGEPAERARTAISELDAASTQLAEAESARDRVWALTRTIQAFESGLAAMRAGLREVAIRETQLSTRLIAREDEIGALLTVLQKIGGNPTPVVLLHPAGPAGTARAGMLLAEMTPELNRRAAELRRDLEDLRILRDLQTDAEARLREGLQELQGARAALNQAMADRTDLPKRFTADPVRTAILISASETLDAFASGLSEIAVDETGASAPQPDLVPGALPLPVQGVVLRAAGEADAAGVTRPGLILATRPGAIVTSPSAATIRYVGPLLDLGQVVILEPKSDMLFVLAGLDVTYGAAGEVIGAGTPLGLMAGAEAKNDADLSPDGDGSGTGRTETLYIEVRRRDVPEDPARWFRTDEDG